MNELLWAFGLAGLRSCFEEGQAHALINELDGPSAAARVAAAPTLLEDNERGPAGNMPRVPGFAILIADARSAPQPIDITPTLNATQLAARSSASE